ncbi:hypothetical protein AOCH_000451 [Aspergillus ochraceoroseus]|nr:hypothetical protein AOCH_000451 [Aspergillus ochraceoroseus]
MSSSKSIPPTRAGSCSKDPEVTSTLETTGPGDDERAVTLNKRYNFTTLVSIFIAINAGWESIVVSLYQVLIGGGPTVLVWGYVISAVGAICISLSLAEFASIWPSAAGQSHWTVALTPPKYRRVVGWYAAWILLFMTVLASVGATYASAMSLQACVSISNPDYVAERWHTYMIFIAVLVIAAVINIFEPRLIHHFSVFGLVVHVLGFFAIMITLLVTTKNKNSAKVVFGSIQDFTGWNNNAMAFFIGMLPGAYGFLAIDAPARYSEETKHPNTDVSRSMFWGIMGSVLIGIPFVLTLAFCMGDTQELLQNPTISLSPLALIILQSTGSKAAAIILSCTVIAVSFTASIDAVGGISRIIMAQARDRALPFSEVLSKVSPRWNTPIYAVLLACFLLLSIAAIYVGNSTAYYGIASGTVVMQVVSYTAPVILNFFFSKKMGIKYGPWNLGRLRYPINGIAIIIYIFLCCIMTFPTQMPATAENMNYASLIIGAVFIASTVMYFTWGRRNYFGPLFDLQGLETPVKA